MNRIGFDRKCSNCTLSCGSAVTGQSEVPMSDVVLIVVSAYPGSNEIKKNMSLVGNKDNTTAGAFLRLSLNLFFEDKFPNNTFEKYVYFTNAIKCTPQRKNQSIKITPAHLKSCRMWLNLELAALPKCPILIASSEASNSLLNMKLGVARNKIHTIEGRKAVATYNPIEWERGALKKVANLEKTESDLKLVLEKTSDPKNLGKLIKPVFWKPAPYGSTLWFVHRDLTKIKSLVMEYMGNDV